MSYEFIDTAAAALTTTVVDSLSGGFLLDPFANSGSTDPAVSAPFLEEGATQADTLFLGEEPDVLILNSDDSNFKEDEDVIVVIGTRYSSGGGGGGGGSNFYVRDGYMYDTVDAPIDGNTPGSSEPVAPSDAPADELAIEITVTIDPVTPEQKVLIEKFKTAVENATNAIRALDDAERIKMNDGSFVTGYELKKLWALTDFVIHPDTKTYANGTTRGEADYNNGNPQISLNIGVVDGYEDHGAAGLDFMILHELGHLTAANRNFDRITSNPQSAVEEMANDIARAIAHDALIPILGPSSTITYGTETPRIFEIPADDGDTGGETGGGGGSGKVNDSPI